MRNALKTICASAALCLSLGGHAWAAICPTTSNTNTDCGYIITVGPGGALTGTAVPNANPYDGNDDSLIGIVNHSGKVYSGSFTLSGSGNGGGLFAFDGDGICTFTSASYCRTAPTGYEGPKMSFSNISSDLTTGTVNFNGIAVGGSDYFSLESSPDSIAAGGGIGLPGGQTPEPGSIFLLGTGVLGAAAQLRNRFRKN